MIQTTSSFKQKAERSQMPSTVCWCLSSLHLSLSLSESSSSTCTACLWYCSWDSTREESWLTCSIYTHTHTHIFFIPMDKLLIILDYNKIWVIKACRHVLHL